MKRVYAADRKPDTLLNRQSIASIDLQKEDPTENGRDFFNLVFYCR